MPVNFDYAILGGGAAGLSLALAIQRSPLKDKSILIVEKEARSLHDRNWGFWTDSPSPFDNIARRVWSRLSFLSETEEGSWDLSPFRYMLVRGLDLYNHVWAELQKQNVTLLPGSAELVEKEDHVEITVTNPSGTDGEHREEYSAHFAFDSRLRLEEMTPGPKYNSLKQHFLGWEVETEKPVFDPRTVTLFDLRTPQQGGVTFFYTLPFSPSNALIEYTVFSPGLLTTEEYEAALSGHLKEMGAGEYRIVEAERGVIPMTDQPFARRLGKRTLSIGRRGGRVKPSTGYAFSRIQRDSEQIVNSLVRFAHPFAIHPDPFRFRLHDSILLELLAKEPDLGRPILSGIFSKNPIQRVLKFLDNRSSVIEDLQIMSSNPPGPFLRAIWRKLQAGVV